MYLIELTDAYERDFENYYAHKSEKEDIYWNGFMSKPDYEVIRRAYLSRIVVDCANLAGHKLIKAVRVNGEYAGYIQYTFGDCEVEIGVGISVSFAGAGVGKKAIGLAIEWLRDNSQTRELNVFARVRDDNAQSQRCFISAGFKRTDEYTCEDFFPLTNKVKLRRYEYSE